MTLNINKKSQLKTGTFVVSHSKPTNHDIFLYYGHGVNVNVKDPVSGVKFVTVGFITQPMLTVAPSAICAA